MLPYSGLIEYVLQNEFTVKKTLRGVCYRDKHIERATRVSKVSDREMKNGVTQSLFKLLCVSYMFVTRFLAILFITSYF